MRCRRTQPLQQMRHVTQLGFDALARMHEAFSQVIEVLHVRIERAIDVPRQTRSQHAEADQQFGAVRTHQFRGRRRRGSARIGDKVGDGEIGFVPYARDQTTSSLNAHKSSMPPPPRQTISTSISLRTEAVRMACAMLSPAPSPCTGVG